MADFPDPRRLDGEQAPSRFYVEADDAAGTVVVMLGAGPLRIRLNLAPATARALADDLARHADRVAAQGMAAGLADALKARRGGG
jgi:hypothetical protein